MCKDHALASMSNKELLELAAKAAGVQGKYDSLVDEFYLAENQSDPAGNGRRWWNPLKDNNDTLWLAFHLNLSFKVSFYVYAESGVVKANSSFPCSHVEHFETIETFQDKDRMFRRAITRLAAELGKID